MKQCLKITVAGKVQNIGYREFVQEQAKKLEVEGTVENVDNGSVLIYACGASEHLDALIDLLYKGPKGAQIQNVTAEPFISEKDFREVFRVIGD